MTFREFLKINIRGISYAVRGVLLLGFFLGLFLTGFIFPSIGIGGLILGAFTCAAVLEILVGLGIATMYCCVRSRNNENRGYVSYEYDPLNRSDLDDIHELNQSRDLPTDGDQFSLGDDIGVVPMEVSSPTPGATLEAKRSDEPTATEKFTQQAKAIFIEIYKRDIDQDVYGDETSETFRVLWDAKLQSLLEKVTPSNQEQRFSSYLRKLPERLKQLLNIDPVERLKSLADFCCVEAFEVPSNIWTEKNWESTINSYRANSLSKEKFDFHYVDFDNGTKVFICKHNLNGRLSAQVDPRQACYDILQAQGQQKDLQADEGSLGNYLSV